MSFFRSLKNNMNNQHSEQTSSNNATIATTSDSPDELTLELALDNFSNCDDLIHRSYPDKQIDLLYFYHIVDGQSLYNYVIFPVEQVQKKELPLIFERSQFNNTPDSKEFITSILAGSVGVFYKGVPYIVDVANFEARAVTHSETESVITGPHDAFTEQAQTNLALIRNRIKSSHLKVVKCSVGEITKTDVYILYIKDIANDHYVQTLIDRINIIEIDAVFDTNMLLEYFDDFPFSVFPQFNTTERPDAISSKLVAGKIIGFVDGSPSAFSAPTSFFEFFSSSDDYYQRWWLGSAVRLLRLFALGITLFFTALYVSITTYHYEMIPENLLVNLTESRIKVPFPPLYEALLMEVTIELLREAGARLPTKIGQTIGIVGGIVIGQAAVQAGLTSNILIIAVAASAIASFVVPSYIMSASIRLLRFGIIILAGLWGNFGIAIGISTIVIHLSYLTSLGASYLAPVAPLNIKDWADTFIIAPYKYLKSRPSQSKSPNEIKMKMKR